MLTGFKSEKDGFLLVQLCVSGMTSSAAKVVNSLEGSCVKGSVAAPGRMQEHGRITQRKKNVFVCSR